MKAFRQLLIPVVLFLALASILMWPLSARAAGWTGTGNLLTTRGWHTATLLPNGSVLVVGGVTADAVKSYPLASAELYDSATRTWSATGYLNTSPRSSHTATLLPNGKVLVAGGSDSSSVTSASAELYDPATGTWTFTGSSVRKSTWTSGVATATVPYNGHLPLKAAMSRAPCSVVTPLSWNCSLTELNRVKSGRTGLRRSKAP